jgi:hypothetical protein
MKNKTLSISKKLTTLLILFFAVSCSNSKGWVYKPNDYNNEVGHSASNHLRDKTISVLPFTDKRSNENSDALLLYMLPLAPFGYQNLSSPETTVRHVNSGLWVNFNPKDDFAKAMVEELNVSGKFKDVFFSNSIKDSEYYISGELLITDYNGKLISYGLSIYGPLLWYIGFPATYVSNDLEVKLSLMDSKSKKVIFTKTYKASNYSKVGWIYSLPNDFQYPEMLKNLYQQFVTDVAALDK